MEPPRAGSRDILPDMFRQDLVDQCLVSDPPALCLLTEAVQNIRIHTDCNQPARSLSKVGRPTRRIARSCSSDASGISEKSIRRAGLVRRPFLPARAPCADDADCLAIAGPPQFETLEGQVRALDSEAVGLPSCF